MKSRALAVGVALAIGAVGFGLAQQSKKPDAPAEVDLVFQNTSTAEVAVAVIQADGTEKTVVEKLAPNTEITVNSLPGNRWVAKLGKDVMAEYVADQHERQIVNLAELATWQLPVEVIFQNDSDSPVDICFVNAEDEELSYAQALRPERQFEQADAAAGSLWRIKQEGKLVAEYLADNTPTQIVDLKALIADYSAHVTLTFQNTTTKPIDVYWLHPDGGSVLYLPNLPAGSQVEQKSFPGHVWTLRQEGNLIGTFLVGGDKRQEVDAFKIVQQLAAVSAELGIASSAANKGSGKTSRLPPKPKKQP